jgi:hypothetical protein
MELEFIQCLANPEYLNWLAQRRYLDDPAFLRYIEYLKYWKSQDYSIYIACALSFGVVLPVVCNVIKVILESSPTGTTRILYPGSSTRTS